MRRRTLVDEAAIRSQRHAWLDHPVIVAHYRERALIDGLPWEPWITKAIGDVPARSLAVGCGDGARSLYLFENNLARTIEGFDRFPDRIEAAEKSREICRAPGEFRVADPNSVVLPAHRYDLVFACHSAAGIVALEHLFGQVERALTARGLFVLEGYVGPSRFQWTDQQMDLVAQALAAMPDRLRMFRWEVRKEREGRPDRAALALAAPFEAIRSGEIVDCFAERFALVAVRKLGGTLQHLLYNGIVHNFADSDEDARHQIAALMEQEDALVDSDRLASDFMLLIGRRR